MAYQKLFKHKIFLVDNMKKNKIKINVVKVALILIGVVGVYTLLTEMDLGLAVYMFMAGMGIYAIIKFAQGTYFLDDF